MPIDDLDAIERKLGKRGFKREDVFFHTCEACKTQAVAIYKIGSKIGGRDIQICLECGVARSWRSGAQMDKREEDLAFDLRAFLG